MNCTGLNLGSSYGDSSYGQLPISHLPRPIYVGRKATASCLRRTIRFAKLALFSLAVVAGFFLFDWFVIHPPIETLGSRPGIEERYNQMLNAGPATFAVE